MNSEFLNSIGMGSIDIGYILLGLTIVLLLLIVLVIVQITKLSKLKKRYEKGETYEAINRIRNRN